MVSTDAPPSPSDAPVAVRKYRPELQGIRAVAATLVVLYHIWFDRVSGGVDVFFLISGFLITGQLVRALQGRGIQFREMWGRMLKRLLPAALTVLTVSMMLGVLILPEDRWLQTVKEVVASALYFENWQLAADSVDYFAQHNTASVAQHYWSMSIQGQFYLVWPLVFFAAGFLARKLNRQLRTVVLATLVVLFVGSLAYSVYLTGANQPLAYFNSFTRIWEFALGGLFALFVDSVTLPRWLRIGLGWLGLIGLVSCGALLEVDRVFPGWIALWPTVAAALIILAGDTRSKLGVDKVLASKPLEYVGNISYALYLWHWPVMLFWLVGMDRTTIGFRGGLLLIGLSFLLAMLTYHFIEKPVRFSKIGARNRWGAYRFAVLALVVPLGLAGAWNAYSVQKISSQQLLDVGEKNHPGALIRQQGYQYRGAEDVDFVPSAVSLPKDWGAVANAECQDLPMKASLCTTKTPKPKKRIMVIGDSHSEQYVAGFNELAEKNDWQLTGMLMGACPFSTGSETQKDNLDCVKFNQLALDEVKKRKPDVVVSMASMDVHKGLTERTPQGFVDAWRQVNDLGIPVVAIRDSPRFTFSPPACAQSKEHDDPSCAAARADYLAPTPPYERARQSLPDTHFLDLSNYICTETDCPPVIGNVWVYLDDNHLSATYVRTMSPVLEQKLESTLDW